MLEQFSRAVENRRDQLVDLTRSLIRFPTINPPGDAYRPCAEFIARYMHGLGFQCQLLTAEGEPGHSKLYPRTNVICRREGKRAGATVHFNGHIDVVETGQGWSVDPFVGVVADGKVFGRGACDMKGGLAAAIIAADAFIATIPDFPGAIEISGTVDEESGGFAGVGFLARQGYFSPPRVDHVIIPEPLNKDRVCLGHRGVWWAEIETHGQIAHGSMPFLGDCAIRHMSAFIEALETTIYPTLNRRQTRMPVVPDGARRSTLNLNGIHGGQAEGFDGLPSPNVADSCRMTIDRRFLIEETLDDVKSEVIAVLDQMKSTRPRFDYQIRDIMEVLPLMTEPDAPVASAVAAAIRDVLHTDAQFVVSPGTYDQKHISRIGHLHDCVAYGPGILDLAHQPDEWIGIEDMVQSATVMACTLQTLLTIPRA